MISLIFSLHLILFWYLLGMTLPLAMRRYSLICQILGCFYKFTLLLKYTPE
jgi:hypothetical protein